MSLLDDFNADRLKLDEEVRSMAQIVLLEMCGSVKEQHGCRPVVAAIVGEQTELHFPTWRTPNEKASTFANISQGLIEREVNGTVVGYAGVINPETDPLNAVILMIETPNDRVMMVRPYRITEDEVYWAAPFATHDFESPLTGIFCAN